MGRYLRSCLLYFSISFIFLLSHCFTCYHVAPSRHLFHTFREANCFSEELKLQYVFSPFMFLNGDVVDVDQNAHASSQFCDV
jgi:hypothetical protein